MILEQCIDTHIRGSIGLEFGCGEYVCIIQVSNMTVYKQNVVILWPVVYHIMQTRIHLPMKYTPEFYGYSSFNSGQDNVMAIIWRCFVIILVWKLDVVDL